MESEGTEDSKSVAFLKRHLPLICSLASEARLPFPNVDVDEEGTPEIFWLNRQTDVLLALSVAEEGNLWVHVHRAGGAENVFDPTPDALRRFLGELRTC